MKIQHLQPVFKSPNLPGSIEVDHIIWQEILQLFKQFQWFLPPGEKSVKRRMPIDEPAKVITHNGINNGPLHLCFQAPDKDGGREYLRRVIREQDDETGFQ
jgi:hypothetical protein